MLDRWTGIPIFVAMTSASSTLTIGRAESRDLSRVLTSAMVVFFCDLTFAMVLSTVARHRFIGPGRVFQGIAVGLLGQESFNGGVPTMSLGALIHFTIALSWSTIYLVAWRRWSALERLTATRGGTIAAGLIYGEGIWLFMRLIVMPLSRVTLGPLMSSIFWVQVLIHPIVVGLPIAFIVGRRRRR